MKFGNTTKILIFLISSACRLGLPADKIAIDMDALLHSSDETMRRMQSETVSWTLVITAEGKGKAIVEVVRSPTKRRVELRIETKSNFLPILTIIERDGLWYVREKDGIAGIYRPNEAPFYFSPA
jgi:hypothetical protein